MKKFILTLLLLVMLVVPAAAFLYDIKMMTRDEIKALTDQQLMDAYIEAMIEDQTSREFHEAAGFNSAKEYNKRKDLLRYIIFLRKELVERDMDMKRIEEWLR